MQKGRERRSVKTRLANIGGTADLWFSLSPRLSVQTGVTTTVYDLPGGPETDVTLTIGVGGLFPISQF